MQRTNRILLSTYLMIVTATIITPIAFAQVADEVWALSQRDFSVGARMTGMSLRGYAGSGDYSALFSNPAGLGYVENTQLVVSLKGFATESDLDILTDGFTSGGTRSAMENSSLGNLGFMYDVPVERGKLVFAAGLAQVRDFTRQLDFSGVNSESTISTSFLPFDGEYSVDSDGNLSELSDLPFAAFNAGVIEYYHDLYLAEEYPFYSAVIPGTTIEQSGLATESGGIYEVNGGVAWQATKDLTAGASVNIVFGDYRFDYLFTETDSNNENTQDAYNVLLDDGSLLEGFDQLTYRQRLDSDIVGVNVRTGIVTKLRDALQLGLTLESPTWTYIEESYSQEFSTSFDRGGDVSYGDRPDDVGSGAFDYSIRTPWRLGVGIQLNIGKLLVIGEGELTDWSQLHLSSDQGEDVFREVNGDIEDNFGISLKYAFGAELEAWGVDLRAGFAFKPSPYKDLEFDPQNDQEIGDRIHVSLGAGVDLTEKFRLDLGISFESERDLWEVYPSDAEGARQESLFLMDEILGRGAAILELTVKL
ncbi:MAG: outer membrane protein transport protein [Bacteroidetes bacterium]|nr:outer membrane protein transport protein [Bacteroidota bacterium]